MQIAGRSLDARRRRRRAWSLAGLMGVAGVVLVGSWCAAFLGGVLAHRNGLTAIWKTTVTPRVTDHMTAWFASPDIPELRLEIPFEHYLTLKNKRDEAQRLQRLFTSDEDSVPGTLTVDDETSQVSVRLKGDGPDHRWGKKWSLRVKIDSNDSFMGMRSFNLQHPNTRIYDHEWLFHQVAKKENLIGLRYLFTRLVLNGEDLGIFAVEEHVAREAIESQRRREGVLVKFDESRLWLWHSEDLYPVFSSHVDTVVMQENRVARTPAMRDQRDAAWQLMEAFVAEEVPASRAFKVRGLARFLAVCELFNAWHAIFWTNVRFHYDPVDGRLEPVAHDAMCGSAQSWFEGIRIVSLCNRWSRLALRDPEVAAAFVEELERLTSDEYQNQLNEEMTEKWERTVATLRLEWPGFTSYIWPLMDERRRHIRAALAGEHLVLARATPAADAGTSGVAPQSGTRPYRIEVGNATTLPVELLGFRVGARRVPLPGTERELLLPAAPGYTIDYHHYAVDLPVGVESLPVGAICRLVGRTDERDVRISVRGFRQPFTGPLPVAAGLASTLASHPFLELADAPATLSVRAGDWNVTGDLLVPDGYTLEAGPDTTLRFADGAVLLASGPLRFLGSDRRPVRLLPQQESWSGVVVRESDPCHWQHVEVRGTTAVARGGWQVTGGVCFQDTDVILEDCQFREAQCEDALNAIRSRLEMRRCQFQGCVSDAFDGDFVTGIIADSGFYHVGGDAIDVSGSDLRVLDTRLIAVGDKAISAGEASRVEVAGVSIESARFGVVSKDLSHVRMTRSTISQCEKGLAAYQKKPEYGPGTLEAEVVNLVGIETRLLAQVGSCVLYDGFRVPEEPIAVEALYQEEASAGTGELQPVSARQP